jgi:hypothetical protein
VINDSGAAPTYSTGLCHHGNSELTPGIWVAHQNVGVESSIIRIIAVFHKVCKIVCCSCTYDIKTFPPSSSLLSTSTPISPNC